jgi:hypothetical protein
MCRPARTSRLPRPATRLSGMALDENPAPGVLQKSSVSAPAIFLLHDSSRPHLSGASRTGSVDRFSARSTRKGGVADPPLSKSAALSGIFMHPL